jgi:hypothetical protein
MGRGGRGAALGLVLATTVVIGCGGGGASAAPALRYAVFLGQMVQAREQIETSLSSLVDAGSGAAPGQTPDQVRAGAESIGAIAAEHRAWLEENPPADCYADAHLAASGVVEGLTDASATALGWADAMDSPELADPGTAYATFTDSARRLLDDADTLQQALDATTCLE